MHPSTLVGPIVAVSVAVLIAATACASGTTSNSDGDGLQVRGQVVEVVARNISEVETLRVRDDAGREYSFTTEGFIGFTPSHLREHQLFGQFVLVTYQERGGRLVAVKVED